MENNKMSVLEELRKKTEQKNTEFSQQELHNEKLEQVYRKELLPKMKYLFDNLKETVDHLNFLEETISIADYSSKYPQFGKLSQKNYKISSDGHGGHANYDELKQINVSFFCEAQGSFNYYLDSKYDVERETEFLHNRKLDFTAKKQSNGTRTQFTVKRKVPVNFHIEVDYNQSKLIVTIDNHENLDSFNKVFSASELNDEFLDALLSYFIRKDSRFVKRESNENVKEDIQSAIQKKQQALFLEEINRKKKSSKLGNVLKKIFSKSNKK